MSGWAGPLPGPLGVTQAFFERYFTFLLHFLTSSWLKHRPDYHDRTSSVVHEHPQERVPFPAREIVLRMGLA